MPAKYYTVGPGSLTFGETGSGLDLSCQVSTAQIEWDSDTEDTTYVLCGDAVEGETTYTANLTATVLQDLEREGVVDYTWRNKGTKVPFEYVPSSRVGATITGECVIQPINVGGDVRTRPTSDLEFPCVGEPDLTYPGAGGNGDGTGNAQIARASIDEPATAPIEG